LQAFKQKTIEFCKSTAVGNTPVQNKKRPKHGNLSPIVDEDSEPAESQDTTTNSTVTTASAQNSENEESMTSGTLQPLRAMRTAKLKAAGSLVSAGIF
jgi:hypothetical protein